MKNDVENRLETLKKDIRYHNRLYHIEARPEISDYQFDMLMKELENLEEKYPQFLTTDSPTQCIGSDCI